MTDNGVALWTAFEFAFSVLGGRMIMRDELEALAQSPTWCDEASGFTSTAASVWDAEVGISTAELAIAKTGTLLLSSGPQTTRLGSLLPPKNVVIVGQNAIVPTLAEALGRLPDRNLVFVSGPSRTADIEGVLVRGVHGPGELMVYVRPA
jgi:L-lactate utilization protein LutC